MQDSVISIHGLCKSYGDHRALKGIDLDVHNGEFLTLLGPSGCGKTTLLRIISGLEKPDSGSLYIQDKNVLTLAPEDRHINMVFQSYALFPHMTVFDNVAFGLRCAKHPKELIQPKVMEMLSRVKLEHLFDRKPNQLSGGQQQRVAIARAIINEPLVLLLDEPLSALDYLLRQKMRIELKALQRRLGITFILVTHDQEEALTLSDRVVVMNNGKIEQVGTPRDVYEEPINLHVAEFIGEANIFKSEVMGLEGDQFLVKIANTILKLNNTKNLNIADTVNIVVRPEDLEVWGKHEIQSSTDLLPATVAEVIYKGSTVDLMVTLENGQQVFTKEFFDEDDPDLNYEIGENVLVCWKQGWEVVLVDDKN